MRKLSILTTWKVVTEGMKKALWEDTVNLFHIEPDEAKKEVFLSAVAKRFRDFKTKLVSGWMTLRRKRTKSKKLTEGKEKENEEGEEKEKENEQGRVELPYEIWDHITEEDWEAFVAQKTTPKAVEKRTKAYISSSKKKFNHHMGPKTYEQSRKECLEVDGFYPSISSSSGGTSSSTITTKKIDRVADWYCSLHSRDANGRRTISDPGTKKIADAVLGWKHKEVAGEFVPKANKDALYMVLGKDHDGRVKGKGGVRLGLKKAYGEEYSATRSSSISNASQDMERKMKSAIEELEKRMKNQFNAILEHMGLTSFDERNITPGDKLSQQDPETPRETPREVPGLIPNPPLLDPPT
ncbi:uncharacterized protein LOC125494217 [Beta vulgaris subsp. vulgaris]|uniref:uncharacterized protein LOC125494217 n=1 Tax=Beta vulgaris subsp. vulgaris TaxID=3555 RepID=UPI0025472D4E|nr:uncharacterized protein LOC125494217 [Beta vulgaris subsp. vulgaris]